MNFWHRWQSSLADPLGFLFRMNREGIGHVRVVGKPERHRTGICAIAEK